VRAVVQRVKESSVTIDGQVVGKCGQGLMVLIGVEVGDTDKDLAYLADKVPNLRIFEDDAGKMNRSLLDIGGQILAISQFTLLGDARGGRRPSFITAARPDTAVPLYEALVEKWRGMGIHVETGVFGADMQVALINDGPVSILRDSHRLF